MCGTNRELAESPPRRRPCSAGSVSPSSTNAHGWTTGEERERGGPARVGYERAEQMNHQPSRLDQLAILAKYQFSPKIRDLFSRSKSFRAC